MWFDCTGEDSPMVVQPPAEGALWFLDVSTFKLWVKQRVGSSLCTIFTGDFGMIRLSKGNRVVGI